MGLTGPLSNPELKALFERLTTRDWTQVARQYRLARGVRPDGRRQFGSIRDAIVAVLKQAEGDLRVRDIHTGVERLLGEAVPVSSVKDYLRRGCRKDPPLFQYLGRRWGYRLARGQ